MTTPRTDDPSQADIAVPNAVAPTHGRARSQAEKSAAEDTALADAVRHRLDWNLLVPRSVSATVRAGIVTLEGSVRWAFQRRAAARVVRRMRGVAWVCDRVLVAPEAHASPVREAVNVALARHGTDGDTIGIASADGNVVLSGYARSPQSIGHAAFAAWGVPGVARVVNAVATSGDRLVAPADEQVGPPSALGRK